MGYRKNDEALECYDKALTTNPRDRLTLHNRLLVLQELEKWDEVVKNCDKILELLPEIRTEILEEKWVSLEPGLARARPLYIDLNPVRHDVLLVVEC